MEETLVGDKFIGADDKTFHCQVHAILDESEPQIEVSVRVTNLDNDEILSEIRILGVAKNPLAFTGTILTGLGYYGLCVGFSICGAGAKIIDAGYRRSHAEEPTEKGRIHVLSGFKSLCEKKGELRGETANAFVACAQKLIPTS